MNELDFSGKQVLVVGGSSGIGNGIAQAFRAKGARVAVCGTRAQRCRLFADEGSHLEGLDYCAARRQQCAGDRDSSSRRSTGSTCWCWRRAR